MDNKFKVGDRVQVKQGEGTQFFSEGDLGTIVVVDSEGYKVEFDDESLWWATERQLEHPKPVWSGRMVVDGKECEIKWAHVRFDLGYTSLNKNIKRPSDDHNFQPTDPNIRAITYCWVTYKGGIDVIRDSGVAVCVMADNFCYKTGRKISLRRALYRLFVSPLSRRHVWEQVLQYPGLVV